MTKKDNYSFKNIIFTGGGSGGHVMPALTLLVELKKLYNCYYIGSINGIEKDLVKPTGIRYYSISTGKLRRYVSFENFLDMFRIVFGVFQSFLILFKYKKNETLVLSTGGFVSIPVVLAARLQRKKIFIHEQTSRVGLANKIASFFADKIFISFEKSRIFFPSNKTFLSGYPLRKDLFNHNLNHKNYKNINLEDPIKPIFLITCGGNGSFLLNDVIKDNLDFLKENYVVIHQVGKKFISEFERFADEFYIPVSFIGDEIIDLLKAAEVVISRAGAGTVCELMALSKKSIFIPLKIAQKNEQYHNAMEAYERVGSIVVTEEDFREMSLEIHLEKFYNAKVKKDIKDEYRTNATAIILDEINKLYS